MIKYKSLGGLLLWQEKRRTNDRRKTQHHSTAAGVRHPAAEDIQYVLKDLPGGTLKEMMETENHLGYEKSEHLYNDDYRNSYKPKRINSSFGNMAIQRM